MNEQINSVDFWVDELTKDTEPEHFDFWENFVLYLSEKKFKKYESFGNWMWNRGYNAGLVNLQTKINTYCIPQWISVKDRLPKFNQKVFVVYNDTNYGDGISIRRLIIAELTVDEYWLEGVIWHPDTSITHWMPLPELPESEE